MPRIRHLLAAAALLSAAAALPAQPAAPSRPRVLVIATGGTIAGVQQDSSGIGSYRAGTLTAQQIVASVPALARFAEVETEQFSNVASSYITTDQWIALARRINTVLAERPELAGVVVTHGTDRLEETAFFLYLTVRSDKPVVVVGAQRPATGLSPDGPMNLLSAVRTAASPQAVGKGVMVVMDERILSAREARKHYQRVGGFDVGEMGMLGVVANGGPEFFYSPTRRHGATSEFDLTGVTGLPTVDLVFSYPGGTGRSYPSNPAGVVVSTTGFTCSEQASYQRLAQAGVVIVTAFPSGENVNGGGTDADATRPSGARGAAVPADSLPASLREACPDLARSGELRGPLVPPVRVHHLTPQKARILLMLALTRTSDRREIQRYFETY